MNESSSNLYTQMSVRKVEGIYNPLIMDEIVFSGTQRDCDSILNSLPEDDFQSTGYHLTDQH